MNVQLRLRRASHCYLFCPNPGQDIYLPVLQKQLDFLDYAIYHLDGLGNFAHVDLLCELENLQSLQILPGEGQPNPLHYMSVLKKVQAARKHLCLWPWPNEVRPALAELSAKGLFIVTSCQTEQEAKDLLRKAEKWSKERTSVFLGRKTWQK